MTRLFRRAFLVLALIVAAPATAAGDAGWFYRGSDIAPDPAWTFGTLPNGLKYAVRRNALPAGQVSIRVRIDAGSLNEADDERGWAHFTEHMVFRGTKSFPDRQARYIWQKLGASFGSDSNASTGATQTVYQLDLPKNDKASLDTSLDVLAEMVDSALFDAATVEAEKRVILAEKGRRPALTTRMIETSWPLIYAGLKMADRDPIGTDATLASANAAGLKAFYERWYRPGRATVIMVGDADPKVMEALIAEHFGDWQADGAAPPELDYGAVARGGDRTAMVAYPGAPHYVSAAWMRPYVAQPDTKARERADFATSIAERIVNRRFEAKARGEAAFLSAGIGQSRIAQVADTTQVQVTAKEGRWREALSEVFAILRDAEQSPPSETEIARELSNSRTAARSALDGEDTVLSQARANQLVGAIDNNSVVASAKISLALLEEFAPAMTPAAIGAATRALFEGEGPKLMLLTPQAVAEANVATALAAAEKVAPATRAAERKVSMDNLPKLGAAGKEVSRQRLDDLDVTIVRFANGSRLIFKRTDFERGSVQVQLRFGGGTKAFDPAKPSFGWLSGAVAPSGIADLDQDGLERLLTGRRMGMSFGTDEDAFVLRGQTNAADLDDQMRLLATKIAYPRWDPLLFARVKSGALEAYELAFASASARAGREFGGFLRPDDSRWRPLERSAIAATGPQDFQGYFAPPTALGPIDGIIVGDVDIETAVKAFAGSVGALPKRDAAAVPAGAAEVGPPPPSPSPATFTHTGDADEAYAVIGWTTFGGIDRRPERRALSLAANILQVRLFDELREAEGATYSPTAISSTSEAFADWGVFYAAAEIRPDNIETFFRIARRIVADLAARPAQADEFARAQNPAVSGIERRLKTNAYWLGALEGVADNPEKADYIRFYREDYAKMTAEDVRAAVAKYVAEAGDWSMLVLPAKKPGGGNE